MFFDYSATMNKNFGKTEKLNELKIPFKILP